MNFTKIVRYYATKVPTHLKGKSKSSQEWLTRQLADPYVEKAKVSFTEFEHVFWKKQKLKIILLAR
jgi:hypothetical protein